MRARHRHFNPTHAGADVVLDGRYGFSLSDNDEVATWEDRSANNNDATQGTSALRPIYKTGAQGGQPVVRFSSGRFISGSNVITNALLTVVCAFKMNTASQAYARVVTTSKNGGSDSVSASIPIPILRNNGGNNVSSWTSSARANISTATFYTCHHFCSTFVGTNCVNRLNESTSASQSQTSGFDINQYRLGVSYLGSVDCLDGDIANVSIFNAALTSSLRKRVQFASAFSFKLSCN